MTKKILSILAVLLFLSLMCFVANKQKTIEPIKTQEEAITKTKKAEKETKEIESDSYKDISNNNLNKINDSLNLINQKLEIVKSIVPAEYEQLTKLEEEIKTLNQTIQKNKDNIAVTQDINNQTINNLSEVNAALNKLIEAFGTTMENSFIISGKIIEINNKIKLLSNETEYIFSLNNTIYDGNIEVDKEVIVVCDKTFTENNVNCVIIIEK